MNCAILPQLHEITRIDQKNADERTPAKAQQQHNENDKYTSKGVELTRFKNRSADSAAKSISTYVVSEMKSNGNFMKVAVFPHCPHSGYLSYYLMGE